MEPTQKIDRPWSEYPVGTKAYAVGGGYWERVVLGWKWCTGATFPTPGGDAFRVQLPEQVQSERSYEMNIEEAKRKAHGLENGISLTRQEMRHTIAALLGEHDGNCVQHMGASAEIAILKAEALAERYREALGKYGRHMNSCTEARVILSNPNFCSCGLNDDLKGE